jgi:hypothetical protein
MSKELRILREIGYKENMLIHHNSYVKTCLILSSKIELKADLVLKAVREWKKLHPLLNASVLRENEKSYFVIKTNREEEADELKNIKLLEFDETILNDNLWKYLFQKEICENRIDIYNENLWNITFFKIQDSEENRSDFKYAVFSTFSHGLTDRRNIYLNLLGLFEIMENIYHGKFDECKEFEIEKNIEILFKEYYDNKLEDEFLLKKHHPRKPPFFKPSNKGSRQSDHFDSDKDTFDEVIKNKFIIDRITNQKYSSLKDLIQFSETEKCNRFKTFSIADTEFGVFLAKCKEKQVKVNGALNFLIIITLKELYNKHQEPLEELIYINSIELRPYLKNRLPKQKHTFNYMANSIFNSFEFNREDSGNEKSYLIENFWQLAREESKSLHLKRIQNNYQFIQHSASNFLYLKENEMSSHYFLTNLGSLPTQTESGSNLFKISEYYGFLNYIFSPFYFTVATLEGTLFISMMCDHSYVKFDLMEQFKEIYERLFKTINK